MTMTNDIVKLEPDIVKTENDNAIDYAKDGYLDLEEIVVIKDVSERTLRRKIDDILKEIGIEWDCNLEELTARTNKIIKIEKDDQPLTNIDFKWKISKIYLEELGYKNRRDKVVHVIKENDNVIEIDKVKNDIVNEVDKPIFSNLAEKIKSALKWQGLRHEVEIGPVRKELELVKERNKKEIEEKEHLNKLLLEEKEKNFKLGYQIGEKEGHIKFLTESYQELKTELRFLQSGRRTGQGEEVRAYIKEDE